MSHQNANASPKQWALEFIGALPDDCTLDDIQYHLDVRRRIEQAAARPTESDIDHEEAIAKARQCLDSVGQTNQ